MKKSFIALAAALVAASAFAEDGTMFSVTPVTALCKNGRLVALEFEALHAGTVTIPMPEKNPCAAQPPAPSASRPKLPERQPVPSPRSPMT